MEREKYSVLITVQAFSLCFLSYFGQAAETVQNLNTFDGKIDNVEPLLDESWIIGRRAICRDISKLAILAHMIKFNKKPYLLMPLLKFK